jgi:hypothetical protein
MNETYKLNLRELNAVLAGLRLLQKTWLSGQIADDILDIANNGGDELTDKEIDELCERLNTGG